MAHRDEAPQWDSSLSLPLPLCLSLPRTLTYIHSLSIYLLLNTLQHTATHTEQQYVAGFGAPGRDAAMGPAVTSHTSIVRGGAMPDGYQRGFASPHGQQVLFRCVRIYLCVYLLIFVE